MACSGPFKYGVEANPYCGCQCDTLCCPPPCCSSITQRYHIGYCPTPVAAQARTQNEPVAWESRVVGKYIVPFPKFDLPDPSKATPEDFVFQAAAFCSIPCETVNVAIGSTGCCIEKLIIAGQVVLRAVGNGIVSAGASASPCNITVLVNGNVGSASVQDGDLIGIVVQVNYPDCCTATQFDTVCTPFNFSSAALFYRTMSLGRGFAYLNVRKLADKVRRLRRRRR